VPWITAGHRHRKDAKASTTNRLTPAGSLKCSPVDLTITSHVGDDNVVTPYEALQVPLFQSKRSDGNVGMFRFEGMLQLYRMAVAVAKDENIFPGRMRQGYAANPFRD
jgi:hypothetical protein